MRCAIVLAAALLQGCLYLPRATSAYDEVCKVESKQMVLEASQVASLGHCVQERCVVLLAAAGVVTAVSAVVSGSIMVTGNIVYWLEKQGRCDRSSAREKNA